MIASHEAASHSHSTCDLVSELQEPHCQASWDGRAVREGAAFIRRIPGPYQQPGTAAHGWQRQLEGVVTTAMHTQRLGIQEKRLISTPISRTLGRPSGAFPVASVHVQLQVISTPARVQIYLFSSKSGETCRKSMNIDEKTCFRWRFGAERPRAA